MDAYGLTGLNIAGCHETWSEHLLEKALVDVTRPLLHVDFTFLVCHTYVTMCRQRATLWKTVREVGVEVDLSIWGIHNVLNWVQVFVAERNKYWFAWAPAVVEGIACDVALQTLLLEPFVHNSKIVPTRPRATHDICGTEYNNATLGYVLACH